MRRCNAVPLISRLFSAYALLIHTHTDTATHYVHRDHSLMPHITCNSHDTTAHELRAASMRRFHTYTHIHNNPIRTVTAVACVFVCVGVWMCAYVCVCVCKRVHVGVCVCVWSVCIDATTTLMTTTTTRRLVYSIIFTSLMQNGVWGCVYKDSYTYILFSRPTTDMQPDTISCMHNTEEGPLVMYHASMKSSATDVR